MIAAHEDIQRMFNEVLLHSQANAEEWHSDTINTDPLFTRWAEAKKKFIDMMGGKLIYEHPEPVTFELDTAAKEDRASGFVDWVYSITNHAGLLDFLSCNLEGLYENKTVHEFTIVNEYDGTICDIPAGMKLGKALNLFVRAGQCKADTISEIILELSRLIQECKVKGKLCFSVHPMDYLTLSENQHNWRSCHALDGEYRSGNLSYMLDDCTAIVYLKSDEDKVLPRFPNHIKWNSKKWRCLMFFDDARTTVWAGRQYPFFSQSALCAVRDLLFEPHSYFCATEKVNPLWANSWHHVGYKGDISLGEQQSTLSEMHVMFDGVIRPITHFVQDAPHSTHYNDLIRSTVYTPWMCAYGPYYNFTKDQPPLVIGYAPTCVHCGADTICDSDTMLCSRCLTDNTDIEHDDIAECTECGQRLYTPHEGIFCNICEAYYCRSCYNRHEEESTRHKPRKFFSWLDGLFDY